MFFSYTKDTSFSSVLHFVIELGNYLIKFENNINYYTFLDLNNIGGSWWVKLEVDNLEGKILKLDAMGMTK
jgi:hypothetical protein